MGEVIGSLLPHAFGIALSPIPIMGLVVMLTSTGGRAKAWAFIAGAYASLLLIAMILSTVASTQDEIDENHSDASDGAAWIRIVLSLLFFFMAYRYSKKLSKGDEEPELPGWMKAIDKMSLVQAFGMGALLMGPKPKNFLILIGASITVAEAGLGTAIQVLTTAVFVLLSLSLLILLALSPLILGQRGEKILAGINTFLGRYNAVVMMLLFIMIGVVFLGNGITGLFD